jgi:hypothetical protein
MYNTRSGTQTWENCGEDGHKVGWLGCSGELAGSSKEYAVTRSLCHGNIWVAQRGYQDYGKGPGRESARENTAA